MHKSMTLRQREVLQLVAEGNRSKEVADALNISVKTAETSYQYHAQTRSALGE